MLIALVAVSILAVVFLVAWSGDRRRLAQVVAEEARRAELNKAAAAQAEADAQAGESEADEHRRELEREVHEERERRLRVERAHRFADRVIEHDETFREDDLERGETGADHEMHNLVAIPLYIQDRFDGVLVAANRDGGFDEVEDSVLLALGDHASTVLHNSQ